MKNRSPRATIHTGKFRIISKINTNIYHTFIRIDTLIDTLLPTSLHALHHPSTIYMPSDQTRFNSALLWRASAMEVAALYLHQVYRIINMRCSFFLTISLTSSLLWSPNHRLERERLSPVLQRGLVANSRLLERSKILERLKHSFLFQVKAAGASAFSLSSMISFITRWNVYRKVVVCTGKV